MSDLTFFWLAFSSCLCAFVLLFGPVAKERRLPRWLIWTLFWINAIIVLRTPEFYAPIKFLLGVG